MPSRILRGLFAAFLTLNVAYCWADERTEAQGFYREGNGLFDQGRFPDAVAAYDRALEKEPQYVEAVHNRALALEMVDRAKSIQAWRKFAELASGITELKYDAARARARLQILESLLSFPPALQPNKYVPEAGDYYWPIARASEGEEWTNFPVKFYLGSAPQQKWQEGARLAFDTWAAVFPMELVAAWDQADIRLAWEQTTSEAFHAGEETDWVEIKRVGGELTGRKVAVVRIDLVRNWSKDEMRAIVTHELGHALGIRGHSDQRGDTMFWRVQEESKRLPIRIVLLDFPWKSLVKQPSQRDLNTLIRLYNTAGPIARFK